MKLILWSHKSQLFIKGPPKKLLGKPSEESDSEEEDDDEDDDDDDDDNPAPPVEGMYDPAEYEHLNVTVIWNLFQDFFIDYNSQPILARYQRTVRLHFEIHSTRSWVGHKIQAFHSGKLVWIFWK